MMSIKKTLVEIPIKYYNILKSYNPNILSTFQNDKIVTRENL